MLEVVARRALAVIVGVATPAQLVAPGSRAPNLTRPVCSLVSGALFPSDTCLTYLTDQIRFQKDIGFYTVMVMIY